MGTRGNLPGLVASQHVMLWGAMHVRATRAWAEAACLTTCRRMHRRHCIAGPLRGSIPARHGLLVSGIGQTLPAKQAATAGLPVRGPGSRQCEQTPNTWRRCRAGGSSSHKHACALACT